jgi:hypothetical protein
MKPDLSYPLLEFVYLPSFEKTSAGLLSDEEIRLLEEALQANPEAGAVQASTGGVRKLRVAVSGRGKRGGARIIYLYVRVRETIYMIAAFAKNVQENLTSEQKREMRLLTEVLKKERG